MLIEMRPKALSLLRCHIEIDQNIATQKQLDLVLEFGNRKPAFMHTIDDDRPTIMVRFVDLLGVFVVAHAVWRFNSISCVLVNENN